MQHPPQHWRAQQPQPLKRGDKRRQRVERRRVEKVLLVGVVFVHGL